MRICPSKIYLILLLICGVLTLQSTAFTQTFRTFNKPVVFDAERKKLSIEYLKARHGIIQDSATIVPKMIPSTFN